MNKSRATSCGPRLIQNLLVETPLQIQWGPKNGFAHIIFKSRFYRFQINIFSLKYLLIIHSAMTAIISRSKLLIFSCVGSLPIITHTEMIFKLYRRPCLGLGQGVFDQDWIDWERCWKSYDQDCWKYYERFN